MKLEFQISTWAFICLLVLLKTGRSDMFNWTSVLSYYREICTIEGDCDWAENDMQRMNYSVKNACCKGCVCGNCNDEARLEKTYAGVTQCLKPVTDENDDKKYRFVVDEPKDGCVTDKQNTGIDPSCEHDITAAPWGNFYPVYSFDMRVNFKNRQCALCHGASHTIKWKVYAFFWGLDSEKFHLFRKYYQDFNSTDIMLAFYPPNRESRAYEHVCHTLTGYCATNKINTFYIPTSVNLTRAQVDHACMEGKTSPFMYNNDNVYKNIFCAICNDRASEISDSLMCEADQLDPEDDVKSTGKTFASLIDHEFIESKVDENRRVTNVQLACLPTSIDGSSVKVPCREISCPALQVRQQDGTCRYPMEKIFTSKLNFDLKLTSSRWMGTELFQKMSKTELETAFKLRMPWPRNWEIVSVFHRIDTELQNSTELFVSIGYKNYNSIDMNYLNGLIKARLSKEWIVDLGNSFTFKQNFHIHGLLGKTVKDRDIVGNMKPLWALRNEIHWMFLNLSSPIWNVLFSSAITFFYKPPGYSLEITKLYLCDQIELHANEFVGTTNAFPLFLKRTGKILYPSQYDMYMGDNGGQVVSICIDDSDYKLKRSLASIHELSATVSWFKFLAYYLLMRVQEIY